MAHYDKTALPRGQWMMQLGTLLGNPLAAAAGLKTMEILRRDEQYERLRENGALLQRIVSAALDGAGHPYRIVGDPTLFKIVFTRVAVRDCRDTVHGDQKLLTRLNATLRAEGVLKSPGKTYPCLTLGDAEFELVAHAYERAARAISA